MGLAAIVLVKLSLALLLLVKILFCLLKHFLDSVVRLEPASEERSCSSSVCVHVDRHFFHPRLRVRLSRRRKEVSLLKMHKAKFKLI